MVFASSSFANNVIVVIIDGARYTETFGAEDTYIPFIWNIMRPQATIFTNFYNEGVTKTNPGHATIVTGKLQNVANNGTERPTFPTIFEYFNQQSDAPDSNAYVIAGAEKLSSISYSTYSGYGSSFGAITKTNNYTGDLITYNNLLSVMNENHPELIIVNFKEVDLKGHAGNWAEYTKALTQVDSLLYRLWLKIENDQFYKDNTTLFITNDHGRHDEHHGGFMSHGDDCEGCRHIMLLAMGEEVGRNQIISTKKTQIDIAPTVADFLSVSAVHAAGFSFADSISQQVSYNFFNAEGSETYNSMTVDLTLNTSISDFIIKRANDKDGEYKTIAYYRYNQLQNKRNIFLNQSSYSFIDDSVTYGVNYWYKLVALDSGRIQIESEPVYATPIKQEDNPIYSNDETKLEDYILEQNYPNPFNPNTTIEFTIPKTGFVTLQLYNMLGQKVADIIEKVLPAGAHKINWTANKLVSGTYIYRLQYGKKQKIKKMILLQ